MNDRQKAILNKALDFIKLIYGQFSETIKLCEFEDKRKLGEAYKGEILLSPKVFDMGTKTVVATILEESFHLKSGFGDKTRNFQDYLINQLIGLAEEKNNIIL